MDGSAHHRPDAPPELIPQFALVREATEAFGLKVIESEGFEADDLIASYATTAKAQGLNVVVVSSDKDLMQLLADGIEMYDPMKNKPIDAAVVMEKFGVEPSKVIEVQALIGDPTDFIPGVPGIGPKTAAALIQEFGDLANLLNNLDKLPASKRKEVLIENRAKAEISYQLVRLKKDVPLPLKIEDLDFHGLPLEQLREFLTQQGFSSALSRLPQGAGVSEATPQKSVNTEGQYHLIQTMPALNDLIEQIKLKGVFAIDTETTDLHIHTAQLVGISIALEAGVAYYIPLAHVDRVSEGLFAAEKQAEQLPTKLVVEALKPILADPNILKIGHHLKFDMAILKGAGLEMAGLADTLLMSYVANGTKHSHGLDALAALYFDHKMIPYKEVTAGLTNFSEVPLVKACEYAAEDADYTYRLYDVFKNSLITQGLWSVYATMELPLVSVIQNMEWLGVRVDPVILNRLSQEFSAKLRIVEQRIFELSGTQFNIASPKQLGPVLFDKMQLPYDKKSKGQYSTGSEILEPLAEAGHEIAAKVLEWRGLAKLISTYAESLKNDIHQKTGRVHTSYAMSSTSTGRLSSSNPNLQNIPIRTEEGRMIRQAFVADQGFVLMSFDYSQIELRLLAEISDMPSLKTAFKEGKDIHALTASQMFNIPLEQITSDTRRRAKAINFGIIYGMSAFGLSKQLGIGPKEAGQLMEKYFQQYPEIHAYMESFKSFARQHGYVETIFGRRIWLPDINSKIPTIRQFSERQAINAPIQGAAADLIKRAMIRIHEEIKDKDFIRLLLQVHDELVFEVKAEHEEQVIALIRPIMEHAAEPFAKLSVPLTVEYGVGANWATAH